MITMEIESLYKHLFGEEYYKVDIGSSYDLNVIKDVCNINIFS